MIMFLLASFAAALFLVTLLTYTLYCYEESNQAGEPLNRFAALALRTALRSMASEALIVLLHPLGLWPGLWSRPERGEAVVVLVHGLFHNQGAWVLFRRRLHAGGYATACFSYPSWRADWDGTVVALRTYLGEILAAHPDRDVHLVGHSLGGLLLRCALAGMDAPRVRSLTTMGTPFGGSKLAPFALGSLGRYLRHGGETVRRTAALPTPRGVRCLALRSPADNMVLPNSALRCGLDGWAEKETGPVSHVAMLHDRGVFAEVLSGLRAAGNGTGS